MGFKYLHSIQSCSQPAGRLAIPSGKPLALKPPDAKTIHICSDILFTNSTSIHRSEKSDKCALFSPSSQIPQTVVWLKNKTVMCFQIAAAFYQAGWL